jgi:hypothetical protein
MPIGLKIPSSTQAMPPLADPTLKNVYKEAILRGCAMASGKMSPAANDDKAR